MTSLLHIFPSAHDQLIDFNRYGKAFVDLRDPEARNVFLKQSFEPEFFEIASAVLSEGGVFFDCGSNFGFCTFGLIPLITPIPLSCHLFEANPQLIYYLKETAKRAFPADGIKVVEGCVSDERGYSAFQINQSSSQQSRVAADGDVRQVNTVLDDYVAVNNIDTIHFIKLDLEGRELHACKGLLKTFKRRGVDVVYFEVLDRLLEQNGTTGGELIRLLEDSGFRVFYCRNRDLIGRQPAQARFVRAGLNRLRLADLAGATRDMATDLIAIHRSLMIEP